jgi:molybdopterin guanine dinucleotide-containing S/N-oxide reductase-like protein
MGNSPWFDKIRFGVTLFGLVGVIRLVARRHGEFRKLLAARDFTAQIKIDDDSQGRWYRFQGGKVTSGGGICAKPEVLLTYRSAGEAARLMTPWCKRMEMLDAIKNFRADAHGDEHLIVHFTTILSELLNAGIEYGTRMADGTTRYTGNTNGGAVFVYVRDGKIVRITPIDLDDKDPEPWTIEARGRKFTPPKKVTISSHTQGIKSTIYSKDRLLYPMKRVDFDPDGERNPQNRGISGYERISWDEAVRIVAGEIKRVKAEHGPGSIMYGTGSHHSWGNLGYYLSACRRFFNIVGATSVMHNPDSWEGWYWGAMHHWGNSMRLGAPDAYSTVEDALKHCDMMVLWSCDPESTNGIYAGQDGTIRRLWAKELGIRFVHVDPHYNNTAALTGGKWLAPKPGTSHAMAYAIAYTWMTEELYDKEFIAKRTEGFAEWRDYILGKEDGAAKTPEWQEGETGIPAREVRALAREWARCRTYLGCGGKLGFGSAGRGATGVEWARAMVCLMAMQGIGKPGVNMGCMQQGTPVDTRFFFPGYAEGGLSGDLFGTALSVNMYQRMPHLPTINTVNQVVPRLKIPEAILEGKTEGYTTDTKSIEAQFRKFTYPAPGHSPVKLYYKYGGSHFGTMVETNRYAHMYRSANLETVVNQSIWMEGEARFADIILPACTNFERWDIGEMCTTGGYTQHNFIQLNHRVITLQHKCIEPLGESRSDFDIFRTLACELGAGAYFSEGMTELDWCRHHFNATDAPQLISWKELLKRGYVIVPPPKEEQRDPVSYRWFYDGRKKDCPEVSPLPGDYKEFRQGLQTQSGKFEFVCSSLKRFDLGEEDPERPYMTKYFHSWEGPRTTDLTCKYPLQLISPHPRYTFHTQNDGKDAYCNDIKEHRVLVDGYYYWVLRINPADAAARGIRQHDLVEAFNDRGSVICAALVTERLPAGVCHSYSSSAVYDPIGEPGKSPDRGGCINILVPSRPILKKSNSSASMSCLVEVRTWQEV